MREVCRCLAIWLTLLSEVLVCFGGSNLRYAVDSNQINSTRGSIVVRGTVANGLPLSVPVTIRVHSLTHPISLTMSVTNLSKASFDELPSGNYVIQVTSNDVQSTEMSVSVADGETLQVYVEVTRRRSATSLVLRLGGPEVGSAGRFASPTAFVPDTGVTGPPHDEIGSCPLDEIMRGTSKRLEEFVENVNRITAVEVLEHERLNKGGKVLEREQHKYNYVAIIEETLPGALNVDEYRDGKGGVIGFPHDIATLGMPSLALIFHPYHLAEFTITCGGHGRWHDSSVWQVNFQQRKEQPARMSNLRSGNKVFPVQLKGAAWIDAENYQIIHLETDLLEPIPEVGLYLEHQALDYRPVQFQKYKTPVWLPQQAEIYLDSGGRSFHHRHTYLDYQIFSVDVGEKVGAPK
jgi:hypothetical protein